MPRNYPQEIKLKAIELRKQGFSYSEIPKLLNYSVPKNTFTGWFKNLELSKEAKQRITARIRDGGAPGRAIAWENTHKRRADRVERIFNQVNSEIQNIDSITAKLCLAMLYLGEGYKAGEIFRFGNSDPRIIRLFLKLLRTNFSITETKLHGKVQCRADQNIDQLQIFWSRLTRIPLDQFLTPQVDKRTLGKPTKKVDYKGVFVIEYYSKDLFLEVKFISDIICERLNLGR